MRVSGSVYAQLLRDLLAEGKPIVSAVHGGSMWPAIPDGAIVRLVPAAAQDTRVGQIVLRCGPDDRLVCHRFAERRGEEVLTWGDTCSEPDGWGPASEIIARVEAIQTGEEWRPVLVRSPLRMRWRFIKRRLWGVLGIRDEYCPWPCQPEAGEPPEANP